MIRDDNGPKGLTSRGYSRKDSNRRSIYIPVRWTKEPIPAVIAIPKEPPIKIRMVVLRYGEPAIRALNTPVPTRPASVKTIMLATFVLTVGASAPANGISPPAVKLRAEAIDA